ncbi:hypothetical protein KMB83_gp11 [Ralstonia phage Anchaing]|uniref:Uncharacterized protein n=1 Tax=Ralstonia phage Anchaing TaxID=2759719 RepID=A0A7G5B8A8_9CAUD|nr:hypothetical protein KMB83_gp11 [Ralstonia phage Anchaing]QMV32531.1 hypothetical protein A1_00011 [Ralstonia phage Anchaing]
MNSPVETPYGAKVAFIRSRTAWATLFGEKPAEGVYGLCDWSGDTVCVGVFRGGLQTLCHECVHAALFILDGAGVDVTESNGEPLAYLTDFLFGKGRHALWATRACRPA